jgi:hypothetical protein
MSETIKNVLAYLDEILVTVLKGYFTAKFQREKFSRMFPENFDLQDIRISCYWQQIQTDIKGINTIPYKRRVMLI